MKYFFILGSNPALSLAELTAVYGQAGFAIFADQAAVLESGRTIDPSADIRRLGGTIKIGEVVAEASLSTADLLAKIQKTDIKKEGKIKFGFSYYGAGKFNLKPLAMEYKKILSAAGNSARWVVSREPNLSSVVVEQNNLTKGGAEFVLIRAGNKILVGKTTAVQPFKDLSARDYGRPARDDRSGMLPPKLAQIMINLARAPRNGLLLDPFCGSGTVITEAALMGYENLIGSDISEKAIADSKKNLEWTAANFKFKISNLKLLIAEAAQISKKFDSDSIDAVITEPYLGPQRGKIDTRATVKQLERLYGESLLEFYKILKTGGRAVMVWPVFAAAQGRITLSQKIIGNFKLIPPLPQKFSTLSGGQNRQTIIYGRPDQRVWREIVILEK